MIAIVTSDKSICISHDQQMFACAHTQVGLKRLDDNENDHNDDDDGGTEYICIHVSVHVLFQPD